MQYLKNFIILTFLVSSQCLTAQKPLEKNQTDAEGRKYGYWEARYPSGTIRYTGQFHNDKPIGTFRYYYESGKIRAINNFKNNGLKAYNQTFSENETLIAEGIYLGQKKDSIWRIYSETGQFLLSEETYSNNIQQGTTKIFYPQSGQLAEKVEYVNGLRHGKWNKYYEDNSILSEGHYINNLLDGEVIFYHLNGKIQTKGMFANGSKVGKWQTFDEQGVLISEDNHQDL